MDKTKIIITIAAIVIFLAGGISVYVFLIQPQDTTPKTDNSVALRNQESKTDAQDASLKDSISLDQESQEGVSESKPVEAEKVSPNLEPKPYVSDKRKFQINVPKGWKVDESGQLGMDATFKSPKIEKVGSTPFTSNMTIDSEATVGRDIKKCAETIKKGMPQLWPGYQLVEDKDLVVSGHPAIIIGGKFTMKSQTNNDSAIARNLQLLVEDGKGTLYTITATGLENSWNKDKDIFNSSLLTFKII